MTTTKHNIQDLYNAIKLHQLLSTCIEKVEHVVHVPNGQLNLTINGQYIEVTPSNNFDYAISCGPARWYASYDAVINLFVTLLRNNHMSFIEKTLKKCEHRFTYRFNYIDVSRNDKNVYSYEVYVPLKSKWWQLQKFCKLYVIFCMISTEYFITVTNENMIDIAFLHNNNNLDELLEDALILQGHDPLILNLLD